MTESQSSNNPAPPARKPARRRSAVTGTRQPIAIEYVEIDGLRVRVAIRPGRGRPLLLFNGIGANLDIVLPFIEAMDGYEVVVFDMPGTGESEPTPCPRRFAGFARFTTRLLDQLGYRGALDVAGVSWGGAMAQQFALDYPERTNRLILAATMAGVLSVPARPSVMRRMITPRRYISRSFLTRVAPEIYGGLMRSRPDLIARHGSLTRRPNMRGYIYQLMAIQGWTSVHRLHRLKAPTLVMGGDDDPLIPLVNIKMLHWLIPKSYIHIFRGGGHLFLLARAHESSAIVRRFLSERRYDGTDPQDYFLAQGMTADGEFPVLERSRS